MPPIIQDIPAALTAMLILVTVPRGMAALIDPKSLALMVAASIALIVFRVISSRLSPPQPVLPFCYFKPWQREPASE